MSSQTVATARVPIVAIRDAVDRLMDRLWSGGVNNPMDAIEQVSYLLFIKLLSERETTLAMLDPRYESVFSGEWSKYAWDNFVTLTGDQLFDAVRSAIEVFAKLPQLTPTGRLLFANATLKIYDRPTLRSVIQEISALDPLLEDGGDLKGDMYEYLLSKLNASGTNGQFRTPRHIIDTIVSLVDPIVGRTVCDPACGTAGFLIAAYRHILAANSNSSEDLSGDRLLPDQWHCLSQKTFHGFDNDANMIKIAIMNLYLHRLESTPVLLHNPLTDKLDGAYPGAQYDYIFANPPFAGKLLAESVLPDINVSSRDTELLFLKWFFDHLAPNGRAGVLVPHGVLFSGSKAAVRLRKELINRFTLEAVVGLPSGSFRPYSGVKTAILIFSNSGPTNNVWFYDVESDGFSLDDRRTPTVVNDLPDLIRRWKSKEDGPRSFSVSADVVRATPDASLASSRYREIVHRIVERKTAKSLLADIDDLNVEIAELTGRMYERINAFESVEQ